MISFTLFASMAMQRVSMNRVVVFTHFFRLTFDLKLITIIITMAEKSTDSTLVCVVCAVRGLWNYHVCK